MSGSTFFPNLGSGIGLRPTHYSLLLQEGSSVPWFEAISENYFGLKAESGGPALRTLEAIRENHAIVLHGVSMSVGSVDALSEDYFKKLKTLIHRIEPEWVSDHLCWTGVDGENLHDLLPLPYTEEALNHCVSRISEAQERLGRRMLIENVSTYLQYKHSEMSEAEFLSELARRADCGILLDLNNVYVSSQNLGFDAKVFLNQIPVNRVGQFHLAGHSSQNGLLIDTHDHPVCDAVWDLYQFACKRFGKVSTLIEWDAEIPDFEVLEEHAERATEIQNEAIENA